MVKSGEPLVNLVNLKNKVHHKGSPRFEPGIYGVFEQLVNLVNLYSLPKRV